MKQDLPFYHLCIETATEVCSVALGNGTSLVLEDNINRKNSHTETLTLQIEGLLDKSGISYKDLKGVALSKGPGSYTGLRVGTSVAKGICYALGTPMVAVDTLFGIAYGVKEVPKEGQLIIPMIDARRQEVYTAQYDHNLEEVSEVQNLIIKEGVFNDLSAESVILCGNGAFKCEGIDLGIPYQIINTTCRAATLIERSYDLLINGKKEDIAYFNPYYHKAPNVTKSKKNVLDS